MFVLNVVLGYALRFGIYDYSNWEHVGDNACGLLLRFYMERCIRQCDYFVELFRRSALNRM